MEHTALDIALDHVVTRAADTGRPPLLGDIAAALNSPSVLDEAAGMMAGHLGEAARDLAHAMADPHGGRHAGLPQRMQAQRRDVVTKDEARSGLRRAPHGEQPHGFGSERVYSPLLVGEGVFPCGLLGPFDQVVALGPDRRVRLLRR